MNIFRSEICFQEYYWEVDYPNDWSAYIDKTVKGYPCVFKNKYGTQMSIGISRDVTLQGYSDWGQAKVIKNEYEKIVYLEIRSRAYLDSSNPWILIFNLFRSIFRFAPRIIRICTGTLIGYKYKHILRDNRKRTNYIALFFHDNWMIHVSLLTPDGDFKNAEQILETFRVVPNNTLQSDA